jgi:hypothetical protein
MPRRPGDASERALTARRPAVDFTEHSPWMISIPSARRLSGAAADYLHAMSMF